VPPNASFFDGSYFAQLEELIRRNPWYEDCWKPARDKEVNPVNARWTAVLFSVLSLVSLTHTLTHALTHSRSHALTHSRTHALTHSLTHALIHSRTHVSTHSLSFSFSQDCLSPLLFIIHKMKFLKLLERQFIVNYIIGYIFHLSFFARTRQWTGEKTRSITSCKLQMQAVKHQIEAFQRTKLHLSALLSVCRTSHWCDHHTLNYIKSRLH